MSSFFLCFSLVLLPVMAWRYLLSNKKITTHHRAFTHSTRPLFLLIPVMCSWCRCKVVVVVLQHLPRTKDEENK